MIRKVMVASILALSATGALSADFFDSVTGKTWRQLTETKGLTWNEVATVCSVATGACAGSVGSVDFSGWVWADEADVRQLFKDLGVTGYNPLPSGPITYSEFASSWAPAIVSSGPGDDGIFKATTSQAQQTQAQLAYVYGATRQLKTPGLAYSPLVQDSLGPTFVDHAFTDNVSDSGSVFSDRGFWLYAAAVPEPSAYALILAGLAVACVGLRRTKST